MDGAGVLGAGAGQGEGAEACAIATNHLNRPQISSSRGRISPPPAPQQMDVRCGSHFKSKHDVLDTYDIITVIRVTINNLGLSTLRSPQNPTPQVQKCEVAELVCGSWHVRNASKT